MSPDQQALFDDHLAYARKLAQSFARSAPGWEDDFLSAALEALAASAESWVSGTKGHGGMPATFKTYATRRLKQRLTDVTRYTRRKKRSPAGRRVELDGQLDLEAIRSQADPLAGVALDEVLGQIPDEREREAVRLHYVEGRTVQEIGQRLGCSRQRVSQMIADALAVLSVRLTLAEQPKPTAPVQSRRRPGPRGFDCPKCNAETLVHTSRKPTANLVVRYRLCPGCNYRVTTEERVRARKQSH